MMAQSPCPPTNQPAWNRPPDRIESNENLCDRLGATTLAAIDRHLFVIFGGTGDLATRKLIPSLYRLITESGIGASTVVMGVGATETDDAGYRLIAERALMDAGLDSSEIVAWCESNLFYQRLTREAPDYQAVRARIERLERARDLPGNRAFYLALPPSVFERAIVGLGSVGLNEGPGWTRLVVEKPFGTDLESAVELNRVVHSYFDESQVYRIDHYLGKETVQNLLNFRFANPMFESLWNRDRVEHVEITVAESIGIERRSGYYEQAGALRDMVQNHLTQLLSLIAMEPPNSFGAEQVRNEKVKVIEAVARVNAENVVFGQYAPGIARKMAGRQTRKHRLSWGSRLSSTRGGGKESPSSCGRASVCRRGSHRSP